MPTLPLTFGLVVAGQLVMAVVMDHFGLFGMSVQPVNWLYLSGIISIIGGGYVNTVVLVIMACRN